MLAASILLAASGAAVAGPTDIHGFGGRVLGRGGGGVALPENGEVLFLNPAMLTEMRGQQLALGYQWLRSEFPEPPAVWWDTNRDGLVDDRDTPLQTSTDYERADGISLILGRPVGDRFGIAFGGFVPVDRVLRITTVDASLPTWFLYENRRNRFDLSLGFGWQQLPGLSVGGAVQVLARARYSLITTVDIVITGASSGDDDAGELVDRAVVDAHEMTLDIVPGFAPVASVYWDVGEALPVLEGFHLGATWRGAAGLPVDVEVDLQLDVTAEEIGELEPTTLTLVVPFQLSVYDHYIPQTVALGAAWRRGGALDAYLDARWTGWRALPVNVAQLVEGSIRSSLVDLSGLAVEDGNDYVIELQNTWSLRAGADIALPGVRTSGRFGALKPALRAGWGYEPSPLVAQGASSAFLDSDRVLLCAGLGVSHDDPLSLASGPLAWDAWFQYHLFADGLLERPDTPYQPGATVDGAPIPLGGHLLAGGLQWSIEF